MHARALMLLPLLLVPVAVLSGAPASAEMVAPGPEPVCESSCGEPAESGGISLIQRSVSLNLHADASARAAVNGITGTAVAPISDAQWAKAIGPGELDYRDMHQGSLGDCYFLASLVSIVKVQPGIIKAMFVKGGLLEGSNPVLTAKFMVNGKQTLVAMNDKVPTSTSSGDPFFAKAKKQNYWPPLIEKAWAKLFGDYKTIESGLQREAFKAITQAPVVSVNHKAVLSGSGMSKDEFWNKLVEATNEKNYVVGAGTGSTCGYIGLFCGHAYAILKAVVYNDAYPQALLMYNPHGSDKYTGALPNDDKGDGKFYLTFDELLTSFKQTDIGETLTDAAVSDIVLSREGQKTIVLEFYMWSDDPFAVQFEWPSNRFFEGTGCKVIEPTFTVAVAKKDSPKSYTLATKQAQQMSNGRASMPGGSGTYVIFVSTRFPNGGSWLKDFVINVYGPSTDLAPSTQYTEPVDLFLTMTGLCRAIMVPGTGHYQGQEAGEYTLDDSTEFNGLPVFRANTDASYASQKRARALYALIFWNAKRQINNYDSTGKLVGFKDRGNNKWSIIDTLDRANAGITFTTFNGLPGKFCSSSLLQQMPPRGPETPVQAPAPAGREPEQWFDRDGAPVDAGGEDFPALDELVATASDSDDDAWSSTCSEALDRLTSLDNGDDIASWGYDQLFPEKARSIAKPGTTCGDTATGDVQSCSIYNHWKSLAEIRSAAEKGNTLNAQCADDCSNPQCTPKVLKSRGCLVDFSACAAPLKYTCSDYGYTVNVPGATTYFLASWMCSDDSCAVAP